MRASYKAIDVYVYAWLIIHKINQKTNNSIKNKL